MPMTPEYFQHDIDAAEARGYARGRAEWAAKVRQVNPLREWRSGTWRCIFCASESESFVPHIHAQDCLWALGHAETPED